jgi:predicted amidophosphoribosyltransferase
VGNIDILALFKYLWAAMVPILIKGWSMIDRRFEQTEKRVEELHHNDGKTNAKIDVLVERSENQEVSLKRVDESIKRLEDLLHKVLLDKSK